MSWPAHASEEGRSAWDDVTPWLTDKGWAAIRVIEPQSAECTFPGCPDASTGSNRAGQDTCTDHQPIVVVGSYVDDRHTEGGHG